MNEEEKYWRVISEIKSALQYQSKDNCNISYWNLIHAGVGQVEIESALSKLVDEKVIEVISKPEKLTNNPADFKNNNITIRATDKFAKFLKKMSKIFGLSVAGLSDMNCLKIVDVVTEIQQILNFTDKNKITIPLWQSIVRFRPLMPADTTGMRDRYCQFRYESVEFLKKIGAIEDFRIIEHGHRWENEIEITLKRLPFDETVQEVDKRWRGIPLKGRRASVGFPEKESAENSEERVAKSLKGAKTEITVGKLSSYNDGSIRYGGKILTLRNQLKDLCRLFMSSPKKLMTVDEIKDEIIDGARRSTTKYSTVAKYVSELRKSLKIHFGKDVIINQKEEGWYFSPPE